MIKVGLAGGRGYVGEEFLSLIQKIPEYEIVYLGSRGAAGRHVSDVYSGAKLDLKFQNLSAESIQACSADVWVIAQPNGQAGQILQRFGSVQPKVVDVSSDFRFDDSWTYGLVEANEQELRAAKRVANPGCYATAVQLALLPLADWLSGVPVAFGVSGFSGAGRTPNDRNSPQRLKDNLLPYTLAGHTHEKEISRHLGREVRFSPHVASFFRGISATVSCDLNRELSVDQLLERYQGFYRDHPLVAAQAEIPEIQSVAGTNRSLIGGFAIDERDRRRLTVVSVIDNLRKGAALQVIQNLNLMSGLDATHGLGTD